ncbi:MAG TPA: FAD-dependent oxidoreductase [Dehalococcoidia bacterium]|nr:FAD-dependent oxidoreductase [Dehalococcoidia bacterium]
MTGHTPLFSQVSRLLNEADRRNREERGLSRRRFLKRGALSLGAAATVAALPSGVFAKSQPRITIVGAGIAGLSAANELQHAGLTATIYEGSNRIGGRMWSGHDIMGPGLTTEIGGEFIDSGHREMLAYARAFNLPLIDVESPSEQALVKAFYFDGQVKTAEQVIEAFRPVADVIARDQREVAFTDYTNYNQRALELDNTPLSDYLVQVGATGFLRELLDVAYLTEYGGETNVQSALNLVFLIGTKTNQGFEEFGVSDQRYKVVGGNQRITDALASQVQQGGSPIRLGERLVAVREQRGGGRKTFVCTFASAGGTHEVTTDILLLTTPFSVLRDIDLDVPLVPRVRHYIDECGYGTNSKLVLGFNRRYWRDSGFSGLFFTDLALQSGWDSSQLQPGDLASLTIFTGGNQGIAAGAGSLQSQRNAALPRVEQIFPGANANKNDRAFRFIWPTYEWSRGSYTSFTPGQYTAFTGSAQPTVIGDYPEPSGQLFFAGEHLNFDFQGYMEGGAVSGKEAARQIARVA